MTKCERCKRFLYRGLPHECKTVAETLAEVNAEIGSWQIPVSEQPELKRAA